MTGQADPGSDASAARLGWHIDRGEAATTFSLWGPLDGGAVPALRTVLRQVMAECPAALVVDLSAVRVRDDRALSVFPSTVAEGGGLPPVPLLLAAADRDVARRLESLDVTRTTPLYPTPDAARAAATSPDRLADRFTATLAADASAPARGREVVQRACAAWWLADLVPAALVVVSELCANAFTHGLPPLRLIVARTGTQLHLVVRDANPQPPLLRPRLPSGEPMESGNGMHLVSAFAGAWGARPTVDGKAVWATLPVGRTVTA